MEEQKSRISSWKAFSVFLHANISKSLSLINLFVDIYEFYSIRFSHYTCIHVYSHMYLF